MKCPSCKKRVGLRINRHCDGYSDAALIKECSSCGLVWRLVDGADGKRIDVVVAPKPAGEPG